MLAVVPGITQVPEQVPELTDQFGVSGGLAIVQVIQYLLGMPGASCFVGTTAFGRIVLDREVSVCGIVAVALLAGSHRRIARAVEDRRHRRLGQIRRDQARITHVGIATTGF